MAAVRYRGVSTACMVGLLCLALLLACSSEEHEPTVGEGGPQQAASRAAHPPRDRVLGFEGDIARAMVVKEEQQRRGIDRFKVFYEFSFTDLVEDSGITFRHFSIDESGKSYKEAHYDHGNGLAVADVDGDGLLDVYFTSQLGENGLFKNLGGGRFQDITDRAGVGLGKRLSVSSSFADIDNDGDEDLYVTTVRHGNVLFENDGQGGFADISKDSGLDYVGHSSGAVFFDFDNDGLLDLFLVNVGVYTTDEVGSGGSSDPDFVCYLGRADAFDGHRFPERSEASVLYKNLGGNTFSDVSAQMGLRDESWSGDASITDFNRDGYPDLYLTNMQGDDHYYENVGGARFVDRSDEHFPSTSWGSMGVKSFDYDNDGLFDLLVTDMHSDMGEPIGFAPPPEREKTKIVPEAFWESPEEDRNIFGNSFFVNDGYGGFEELSDELGLENLWPWGVSVGDLNADGYEDVFITASMNYRYRYAGNSVLLNNRGERFLDSEFLVGVEPRRLGELETPWFTLDCQGGDRGWQECLPGDGVLTVMGALGSRTSAIFDVDNDGDLDILTGEFNSRPQLLISDLTERRGISFIKIKLVGRESNRNGIGALVEVFTDAGSYAKYHDGSSGYLSHSQIPLYFGLGEDRYVDRIQVTWPSGRTQTIIEVEPNSLVEVLEAIDDQAGGPHRVRRVPLPGIRDPWGQGGPTPLAAMKSAS